MSRVFLRRLTVPKERGPSSEGNSTEVAGSFFGSNSS